MANTPSRKQETAYHEAGHAVIARVLTLACGGGTIRPNYRERVAGELITDPPSKCEFEWERRGKARESNAVLHARIITYMAGAEAVEEFFGAAIQHHDRADRRDIALMAEELFGGPSWDRLEPRLRAMTRTLVRRHRVCIDRVAEAFLTKTTLSREQLDRLVGRSVDDVKVNAPFLLAMHQYEAIKTGSR